VSYTTPYEITPEQRVKLAHKLLLNIFFTSVDDCWAWTGKVNALGYGYITGIGLSKTLLAHRVSFWFANGYWPEPVAFGSPTATGLSQSRVTSAISQRASTLNTLPRELTNRTLMIARRCLQE
jgi:hypothetical protein